ncbi:MAG: hypothetical protein NTW74_19950, partial [Acidobacteria bacterium]|nr:hypothetical protein [Acidobacteriota bacterium]
MATTVDESDAIGLPVSLVTKPVFDKLAGAAKGTFGGLISESGTLSSSAKYLEGKMHIQGSTPDIFAATPKGYQGFGAGQQAAAVGATYGAIFAGAALVLTPAGPMLGLAAVVAAFGAPSFSSPRVCTLVIVNGLGGALTRKDMTFDCGIETHYPAMVDPTQTVPPVVHEIPGLTTLHLSASFDTHGVGAYRFENNRFLGIGFEGTAGAIAFTSDDPRTNGKVMAISWLIPSTGKRGMAVTDDLSNYASLSDFYYKTADTRTITASSGGDYFSLNAGFCDRDGDEDDVVLTVLV